MILVTGALGYIGSHICVQFLNLGQKILAIDNLTNSKIEVLDQIKSITRCSDEDIIFHKMDIRDIIQMDELFRNYKIDFVIHLAGLKAVNESIMKPLKYYQTNVMGTMCLLEIMEKNNCKKIIFSSSATVYGTQKYPVNENDITGQGITNPYGRTKYMLEEILKDLYISDNNWSIVILRYFNPVGAHFSGIIGEDPNDIPNNLFPHILKVANDNETDYKKLRIFGSDYNKDDPECIDGTCRRDFIHVLDLADGHICATSKLNDNGLYIYNLGSGCSTSVLEIVKAFEKINNVPINYEYSSRREGDLPNVYAIVDKAHKELNWKTKRNINDICKDGWAFVENKNIK